MKPEIREAIEKVNSNLLCLYTDVCAFVESADALQRKIEEEFHE